MQLPRGTFCGIRKRINLATLLGELEQTRFSGVCNISQEKVTGTLVFHKGRVILADFQDKMGDAGWEELGKAREASVDASLSTLTEAQVQLALEFNKLALVKKIRPAQSAPPTKGSSVTFPNGAVKAPAKPALSGAPLPKPKSLLKATPITKSPIAPGKADNHSATAPSPLENPADMGECSEMGSFESDIATFDRMNLEEVASKIRKDCKTMIKDLDLEHLIER
jgi:hypothetical protein